MNYKEGLVSVIVPVYNAEKYIEECINSINCQTYQNIDIMLIDERIGRNVLLFHCTPKRLI